MKRQYSFVNSSNAPTQPATRPLEPTTTGLITEHSPFNVVFADVLRSLRRLGVPDADRDDLAQEILIAVYRKRPEYHPDRGVFNEWVHGFVVKSTRAYWRTRNKISGSSAELPPDLADTKAGVEEQTMTEHLRRLLHEELFPQVEFDLLTVVIGHDLDDLKFEAIAAQQEIPLSTAHDRYQRGIAQLHTAYKRHQLRQKAQGLVVLPLPLAQLLAADRVLPEVSDEMVERAWSRVQRAIRWKNRWAAVRTVLQHPALHLAFTFVGGVAVGLALRPTSPPAPVVFVQPTFADPAPVVTISTATASTPMSAVAELPVSPASSAQHRKPSTEQQAFDVAHQAFLRGSFKEALAALKAHERDYPAGELATERATLRAQIARLSERGRR